MSLADMVAGSSRLGWDAAELLALEVDLLQLTFQQQIERLHECLSRYLKPLLYDEERISQNYPCSGSLPSDFHLWREPLH